MAFINTNFLDLKQSYLFSEMGKRVAAFQAGNPGRKVISLGIGDVTRPLPEACLSAMHRAVDEMGDSSTFRGYSPDQGYAFLREAIVRGDFQERGVDLSPDEIFVSDGAKSDTGNIGDIFNTVNTVAITDPVYPVYADTNIMAGREIKIISCTEETGFAPLPPDFKADIIYLCSPNNPTGSVLNKTQLEAWVAYALENHAVILFDAAYEKFISEKDVPHSIYEIEGAKKCAIEFRSFSKTAGFTGVRCAYTVVPKELKGFDGDGNDVSLHSLWYRRQGTKFNGTSYIVQRAAEAVYTTVGQQQIMETIGYYRENAKIILDGLRKAGFSCSGGVNAPYIWLKCPAGVKSWELFDRLLNGSAVVGTPGAGFGSNGEGYFRLTAFGNHDDTLEAVERIRNAF